MALLSTFTNAGAACMASGANCFAHSLPTTPDWAVPVIVGTAAISASSVPLQLVSRGSTMVAYYNGNGAGANAEQVSQFVHSIQR